MFLCGTSLIIAAGLAHSTFAYIPASPTNSTSDAIAGGLNITDISNLHLQWFSNGCVYIRRCKQLTVSTDILHWHQLLFYACIVSACEVWQYRDKQGTYIPLSTARIWCILLRVFSFISRRRKWIPSRRPVSNLRYRSGMLQVIYSRFSLSSLDSTYILRSKCYRGVYGWRYIHSCPRQRGGICSMCLILSCRYQ